MCVLAVAALALAAGSTYLQYEQGHRMARRQDQAIADQRAADAEALTYQKDELNRSVDENISIRARQAEAERGRIASYTAESGLGDNSGRLANVSRFNEGFDITSMNENRNRQLTQMTAENKAAGAALSSRSASIQRPSMLGSALSLGAAGLNFLNQVPPGTFSSRTSSSSSASDGSPSLIGDFPANPTA